MGDQWESRGSVRPPDTNTKDTNTNTKDTNTNTNTMSSVVSNGGSVGIGGISAAARLSIASPPQTFKPDLIKFIQIYPQTFKPDLIEFIKFNNIQSHPV